MSKPRYFFERESPVFRKQFADIALNGHHRVGASDNDPLVLHDVRTDDFSRFLWVFYNPCVYFISSLPLCPGSISDGSMISCAAYIRFTTPPLRTGPPSWVSRITGNFQRSSLSSFESSRSRLSPPFTRSSSTIVTVSTADCSSPPTWISSLGTRRWVSRRQKILDWKLR